MIALVRSAGERARRNEADDADGPGDNGEAESVGPQPRDLCRARDDYHPEHPKVQAEQAQRNH